MATKTYISTKGFDQYMEKIVAAGRDVDASAQKALLAGAEVAKKGMQRRVAKDKHNLEKHIKIDGPHQEGNFSYADVGVIPKKQFTDAKTARYGVAQEYGTSSMPAHPYIRPTIKGDSGKVRSAMRKSLKEDGTL